jgi:hypothetical protein
MGREVSRRLLHNLARARVCCIAYVRCTVPYLFVCTRAACHLLISAICCAGWQCLTVAGEQSACFSVFGTAHAGAAGLILAYAYAWRPWCMWCCNTVLYAFSLLCRCCKQPFRLQAAGFCLVKNVCPGARACCTESARSLLCRALFVCLQLKTTGKHKHSVIIIQFDNGRNQSLRLASAEPYSLWSHTCSYNCWAVVQLWRSTGLHSSVNKRF